MARVTITLPDSDETVGEQLVRILGDLPVLPSGEVGNRTVTLVGLHAFLVAALYLIYPEPGGERAHALAATIEEVG